MICERGFLCFTRDVSPVMGHIVTQPLQTQPPGFHFTTSVFLIWRHEMAIWPYFWRQTHMFVKNLSIVDGVHNFPACQVVWCKSYHESACTKCITTPQENLSKYLHIDSTSSSAPSQSPNGNRANCDKRACTRCLNLDQIQLF